MSNFINAGRDRPKIRDIYNHVVPKWAPKWRELGAQLDIDQHLMDIIEKDHPNDCKRCCIEMFSKWLDGNPISCWEDITTAVDNLLITNGKYICKLCCVNFTNDRFINPGMCQLLASAQLVVYL